MTGNPSSEETAVLRRGMQEFADAQAGPGPALPALLDGCHRARGRQRALRAGVVGVCVAAVAAVVVVSTQRTTPVTTAPAATRTATDASPTTTPLPARTEYPMGTMPSPPPLPPHPVYGTAYLFDWYAHCGMEYITFGGKVWKTDRPVEVPKTESASYGPAVVPGYVTLVSPTVLRFDAPTFITGVGLHPTTDEPPLCD